MSLFRKPKKTNALEIPSWETVVELMHDKHLPNELVRVLYSKDNAQRFVILQSRQGFFTYQLEKLCQYDSEEWQYIGQNKNALPAMWEPEGSSKSIFETLDQLLTELKTHPSYQQHFC